MGMHCNKRIQQSSLLRQALADPSWSWTRYLHWLESGRYCSLIGGLNFFWGSWLLGELYLLAWGYLRWIICYPGSVWWLQRHQFPARVGLVLYQTQTPYVLPPAVAWHFDFVCSSPCVLLFAGCSVGFLYSSHMGKLRLDMKYVLENPSAQYVLSPASPVLGVMLEYFARLVFGCARWYNCLSGVAFVLL